MVKKKKEEEHVNLERWMVSYADFMTLLFATFVVLYALAQLDIKDFGKLEESIRAAFTVLPIEGGQNIMDGIGESIIGRGSSPENDAIIPPMMEYLNQKYERTSMESIKKEIEEEFGKNADVDVSANMTERGLVITLKDLNVFFKSGSAQLTPEAVKTLTSIGQMINKKFKSHLIRIEGHTDSLPVNSSLFPSNWELSAARSSAVARFLISKFSMNQKLFTVVGYGDTKPLTTNSTSAGRSKNRRIEIVVLKNQVAKYEPEGTATIIPKNLQQNNSALIQPASSDGLSDAARELLKGENAKNADDVIILDEYNKPDSAKIKEAIDDFEKDKNKGKNKFSSKF